MTPVSYPGFKLRPGLAEGKRIVLKFGTSALTHAEGGIDPQAIRKLCRDIAWLHGRGTEVVVVSSGAIHAARPVMREQAIAQNQQLDEQAMDVLQACSALGQPLLMHAYKEEFDRHGIQAAQVLLTHQDFKTRVRHINASNTLKQLLNHRIVPILNENDSVSYREIAIGDNDQLAAMTAGMLNADALVILTTPDGLYDRNPDDPQAVKINTVGPEDPLPQLKFGAKSSSGRGGMRAKLYAIRKLSPLGIPTIVATFNHENPIRRALGSESGTLFLGDPEAQTNDRETWMLSTARMDRAIHVDQGAANAIGRSSSLLPSGIVAIKGEFRRGDCVAIIHHGVPIAVGLTEYNNEDLSKIAGQQAQDIESLLGYCHSNSVVLGRNIVLRR